MTAPAVRLVRRCRDDTDTGAASARLRTSRRRGGQYRMIGRIRNSFRRSRCHDDVANGSCWRGVRCAMYRTPRCQSRQRQYGDQKRKEPPLAALDGLGSFLVTISAVLPNSPKMRRNMYPKIDLRSAVSDHFGMKNLTLVDKLMSIARENPVQRQSACHKSD